MTKAELIAVMAEGAAVTKATAAKATGGLHLGGGKGGLKKAASSRAGRIRNILRSEEEGACGKKPTADRKSH